MNNLITIPKMTHPLSKGWDQPNQNRMLIDDEVAIMDSITAHELKEYSCSTPTGVYEGKMWRSFYNGNWYLNWWDNSDEPDKCIQRQRLLLVI
jgi:hypothetical protein